LLASRFMSYSFERLELTSNCLEDAACVKCGALTNNMLAEDQPCVSLVQQKVRVAASTFRKGGTLCALCACSSRVNLFKLGGHVQGQLQVPGLGIVQNFEDWQVAPGLLVDPGHTFLSPILLPFNKKLPGKKQDVYPRDIAAELLAHRNWLSTRFTGWYVSCQVLNVQGAGEQGVGGGRGGGVCGGEGGGGGDGHP